MTNSRCLQKLAGIRFSANMSGMASRIGRYLAGIAGVALITLAGASGSIAEPREHESSSHGLTTTAIIDSHSQAQSSKLAVEQALNLPLHLSNQGGEHRLGDRLIVRGWQFNNSMYFGHMNSGNGRDGIGLIVDQGQTHYAFNHRGITVSRRL